MSDPLREVLDRVSRSGSTADVALVEQEKLEVEVRAGEPEKLARAHDRVLSLRIFRGSRSATVSSSDLTGDGIAGLVERARDLAEAAEEDPCTGPPDDVATDDPALDLDCPRTASLEPEEALERARTADRAACAADPRVQPIGLAGVRTSVRHVRLVRWDGFDRSFRSTAATAHCVAIAEDGREKQRDASYRDACSVDSLPDPETLGRDAADRAVRRLGAEKIPTERLPVIFEPRTAISLTGHLGESLVGTAIDQGRSCLADRRDRSVAAPKIGLVDDGRLPGHPGSRPFDGEGVATRRTALIERGVLRGFLLDTYTARRLDSRSTGNAARPLRGSLLPSAWNLYIEPGTDPPERIVSDTTRALLVTDLLGFGFNPVTGDYSRGVAGLWIEDGVARRPVQEVTVAGNLLTMLEQVDAIGDDLTFFGGLGAPTLRFRELVVAGV